MRKLAFLCSLCLCAFVARADVAPTPSSFSCVTGDNTTVEVGTNETTVTADCQALADAGGTYFLGKFFAVTANETPPTGSTNELVTFGDSYVDACCWTNGRTFAEWMAVDMGLPIQNFGHGGDTARQMRQKVSSYVSNVGVNPNAAYVLWNIGNEFKCVPTCGSVGSVSAASADDVRRAVLLLTNAGATDVTVLNVFSGGITPEAINAGIVPMAEAISATYAQDIREALAGLNVHLVETWDFMNGLRNQFADSTHACGSCSNPDTFMWWDDHHPTTVAHHKIAQFVEAQR